MFSTRVQQAELELYGKVINTNNPFPPNNPHEQNIKTLYCKYSKNTQYTYKAVIYILSKNWPTCANRTTGRMVFLNWGTWFQTEFLVEM